MKDFSSRKEHGVSRIYGTVSPIRLNESDCLSRSMNRDQAVYVRSVFSQGHLLTSINSQGANADDFNPDRFINADGQMTPALADTKDGSSVTWR